jgi:hypothetical protein
MRRRQPAETVSLPRSLRTFDSTEWWGRDDAERMGEWIRARREWAVFRGLDELPGDDLIVMPDGEFRPEEI